MKPTSRIVKWSGSRMTWRRSTRLPVYPSAPPLALMVLGMASCMRGAGQSPPWRSNVVADSSDQILEGMTTTITRDGVVPRAWSTPIPTYMYTDQQLAVLRRPPEYVFRRRRKSDRRRPSRRKRGNYHISVAARWKHGTACSSRAWMEAIKPPPHGNHLIYDRDQNQIRSDSAFVYESPTEVLTGQTASVSDPGFKQRGDPPARRAGRRGEGMLLRRVRSHE